MIRSDSGAVAIAPSLTVHWRHAEAKRLRGALASSGDEARGPRRVPAQVRQRLQSTYAAVSSAIGRDDLRVGVDH